MDFTRLNVARRVNDLIDVELQALLLAEGIDPKTVKTCENQPGMLHLINGEVVVVSGYIISFPFEAQSKGISLNLIRPNQYGIDFFGDALFCNETILEEAPEVVERFINASLRGWECALANSKEIANRIAKELIRSAYLEDFKSYNHYQIEGEKMFINFQKWKLVI